MKNRTLIIGSHPAYGGIARLQEIVPQCLDSYVLLNYENSGNGYRKTINLFRLYRDVKSNLKQCNYVLYLHPHLARLHSYLRTRLPYGFLVHGYEIFRDITLKLNGVFKHADTVICSSNYMRKVIEDQYTVKSLKQNYYPTIDLASLVTSNLGNDMSTISKEGPIVLAVGRMASDERYKGHDQILNAWPIIQRRFPGTQLIVVGDGNDRERLIRKAEYLGIDQSVHFLGHIEDRELAGIYSKADLFLLPSSGEGQGLVYLEAMQFGLPIVALKYSPAGEFVTHNKHGFLLPGKNVDNIVEALTALLADSDLRKRLSRMVLEKYRTLNIRSSFCSTLREVVTSNNEPE